MRRLASSIKNFLSIFSFQGTLALAIALAWVHHSQLQKRHKR